jgi:FkbM family methyltransferase
MDTFKNEFAKIEAEYNLGNQFKAFDKLKADTAGRALIIYGCGFGGVNIAHVCAIKGIKIDGVCDANKNGVFEGTGQKIMSPSEMRGKFPDAKVVIASYAFENEIADELRKLGFSDTQILPFPFSHSNVIAYPRFVREHCAGYEWAYDFFSDDISKKIILDRARLYLLGANMSRTSSSLQYFEQGVINLAEDEVFVDGGCFDGGTAIVFIEQAAHAGRGYRHVYSFEPDPILRETAVKNLARYANIDVIPKGLWSSDTELKFFNNDTGGSSFVIAREEIKTLSVPVTSLDNFFKDKSDDELPTFIKYDIEGSEKEALLGAEDVIRKKRPKLAICVYHKHEDIYELPRLVYSFNPNYRFTLRQYEDGPYETVMYAV